MITGLMYFNTCKGKRKIILHHVISLSLIDQHLYHPILFSPPPLLFVQAHEKEKKNVLTKIKINSENNGMGAPAAR